MVNCPKPKSNAEWLNSTFYDDNQQKSVASVTERRQRQLACELACTGVSFIGDPTDAVKALAKALMQIIAERRSQNPKQSYADKIERIARAALARVRLDTEGETK